MPECGIVFSDIAQLQQRTILMRLTLLHACDISFSAGIMAKQQPIQLPRRVELLAAHPGSPSQVFFLHFHHHYH